MLAAEMQLILAQLEMEILVTMECLELAGPEVLMGGVAQQLVPIPVVGKGWGRVVEWAGSTIPDIPWEGLVAALVAWVLMVVGIRIMLSHSRL